MIDFRNPVKICVFGLTYSGKTYFVKEMLKKFNKPVLIYDWNAEYADLPNSRYIYYQPQQKNDDDACRAEMTKVLNRIFIPDTSKFKMLVVDEANNYCQNKSPLPSAVRVINDTHAHMRNREGVHLITVTRRPADLNTSLVETAHYLIIFKLDGKNDIQCLNNVKSGLGDLTQELKRFEYIIYNRVTGDVIKYPPLKA